MYAGETIVGGILVQMIKCLTLIIRVVRLGIVVLRAARIITIMIYPKYDIMGLHCIV